MHCLGRDGGSSIGRMGAHPATASPLVRRVAGVHAGSAASESAVFPGLTVVPEDVFAPA